MTIASRRKPILNTGEHGLRDRPPIIEYSRPGRSARVSRLAVASMFISIFACPCVWPILLQLFSHYVLRLSAGVLEIGGWAGVLIPPVIALIAFLRIRRSRGDLGGEDYVYFAFTFCTLWIIVLIAFAWLAKML